MASQSPIARAVVVALLLSLSAVAWYSIWTASVANGTFTHIRDVFKGTDVKMPGTDFSLVRHYTGIAAVDKQLVILVTFFARAVDGSTSGFASWGMSQFGAAWYVMVLEGLRAGNKGRIVSRVTIFGVIFQIITFAVTTPIWLAIHLLTSPVAKSTSPSSSLFITLRDLNVIPLVLGISYIFPSLLMGFPSPEQTTPENHQLFIVVWQFFPLFTSFLQWALPPAFQYRLEEAVAARKAQFIEEDSEPVAYLSSSKNVYLFALILCAITHVLAMSSLYFGTTFADMFLPFSISNPGQQVPDLATGVQNFLQWDIYIGLTGFVLWSLYLYLSAPPAPGAGSLIAIKVVFWAVVAGPMGIVLVLLGARDDAVLYQDVLKERKAVSIKKKN